MTRMCSKLCRFAVLGLIAVAALVSSCGHGQSDLAKLKADGQKLFLDQRYREARDCFLKGLAVTPSDRDFLYYTGLCYKRDFIYDSALLYLKRADLLYPNDRELNLELYAVANATQSWQVAADCINTLIESGDPLDKYLEQLVILNVKLEQPMSVVYYLRRLTTLHPDSALFALQLANGLITLDSLEVAEQIIDSAITRFGERNEFIATRATIGAYRGKFREAEKIFRDLMVRDSAMAGQYKLNLANVLSMQSDRGKKLEALSLYREIRPTFNADGRIDSLIDTLEKELR